MIARFRPPRSTPRRQFAAHRPRRLPSRPPRSRMRASCARRYRCSAARRRGSRLDFSIVSHILVRRRAVSRVQRRRRCGVRGRATTRAGHSLASCRARRARAISSALETSSSTHTPYATTASQKRLSGSSSRLCMVPSHESVLQACVPSVSRPRSTTAKCIPSASDAPSGRAEGVAPVSTVDPTIVRHALSQP